MPERLKSLELHGYKTFANRTLFEFSEHVTAIVGPNGSGKSNIADSVRWVLGEQSYHLLRGKKTEDMIFSGSEQRARAGMASATITFDNTDGWLPIDFSEVAITRRAYRDGANEYLINGQRTRLKDVSELLAQSGLAERTYTIIGQGLVDAALALRAEDRRRLFEEAAGIGLYRVRKEEALRRLEITRRNLERASDILTELEPRLISLEKQAKRAIEYEQLLADLRLLLRDWYGFHWHHSQQELKDAYEAVHVQESQLEKARAEHVSANEKLAAVRDRIQNLRANLNSWHRQSAQFHTRREALSRDLAVSEERARLLELQSLNLANELARAEEEDSLASEQCSAIQVEVQRLNNELDEALGQVENTRQRLVVQQEERLQIEEKLQNLREASESASSQQEKLRARHHEKLSQAADSNNELENISQAVQKAVNKQLVSMAELNTAKQAQSAAEIELAAAEKVLRAHDVIMEQYDLNRRAVQEELAGLSSVQARLQAQSEVLEQAEDALTGYANGTKLLLQAANQSRLTGTAGALSHFLDVPVELEAAITAVLGEYLDAVLLRNSAEEALDMLDREAARGVLLPFLTLDSLVPLRSEMERMKELLRAESSTEQEWIGIAAELISVPVELRPIIDLLLGTVWVVRDRASARRFLSRLTRIKIPASQKNALRWTLRAVTLKGEVYFASGPIIAGGVSKSENSSLLLSRQRQGRQLKMQIEQARQNQSKVLKKFDTLASEGEKIAQEKEQLEQALLQARHKVDQSIIQSRQKQLLFDQAKQNVDWQKMQSQKLRDFSTMALSEAATIATELEHAEQMVVDLREQLQETIAELNGLSLDELQENLAHWSTEAAVTERALNDERRRLVERQETVSKIKVTLSRLQTSRVELEAILRTLESEKTLHRMDESEIRDKIEELSRLIEPAEVDLEKMEREQSSLEEVETGARQSLSLTDHHLAQTRVLLARRLEAVQSLRRRIEDDFGLVNFEYAEQVSGPTPLPLEGMVEQLPKLIELGPELEESIRRQRALLRRMGPINPEAQTEYLEVRERHEFLTEQMADLHRAEIDVRQVIEELDEMMVTEFHKTFDAVATEYKSIFPRLFGGGSARLVLSDPENPSESGIDIEARLPGRRTQGLSLLSGGERSLTATALIFALLRVSPTPFCLLDEVDAMLDEVNIGRFRELLTELSEKTQFVIVTHNRNTVQAADTIYGVTMGRDSTSQVISLKMEEVKHISME